MAFIESQQNPGIVAEVDVTHRAERMSLRPLEHQTLQGKVLGHYRFAARSGALTGTGVTAGGPLFSLRWGDATNFLVLTYLSAQYVPTVLFTAFQELGLDAAIVRGFTVADTAGTAITLTGNSNKTRTAMAPSLVSDLRIGATTILTASGSKTVDGQPFAAGSGGVNQVNAAAATAYINPSYGAIPYGFSWEANAARGEHPIVLAANEGINVRNAVVFPAAGTAVLIVNMAWAEVAAY